MESQSSPYVQRTYGLTILPSFSLSSFSVPSVGLNHLKRFQLSFVIAYIDMYSNNLIFLEKHYISSVSFELNSLVGMSEVLNLAQSEILKLIFLLITLIILVVKSVATSSFSLCCLVP